MMMVREDDWSTFNSRYKNKNNDQNKNQAQGAVNSAKEKEENTQGGNDEKGKKG